jgi:hypothetical protein
VSEKIRNVMVLVGWVFAAVVCVMAAWGFFDHIAIESFGAGQDDPASTKIGQVVHQLHVNVARGAVDHQARRFGRPLDLLAQPGVPAQPRGPPGGRDTLPGPGLLRCAFDFLGLSHCYLPVFPTLRRICSPS